MLVKSLREDDHLDDHLDDLQETFDTLQETFDTFRSYNIKLNPNKCMFGMMTGKF